MFNRLFAAAVIVGFAVLPLAASADPEPAKVVSVANTPVVVTRCTWNITDNGRVEYFATITNRATRPISSADVRFQFLDDGGPVGQLLLHVRSQDDTLAAGDSTTSSQSDYGDLPVKVDTLRNATCRIQSATFATGRRWQYGHTYWDKLLPVSWNSAPRGMSDSDASRSNPQDSGGATSPSVAIAMGQAWVTHVPDVGSFVHVRVTLTAPSAIEVSPSDFRMNMTLVNGAAKAYSPLQKPAPLVLRGGLISYTGDPNELTPSIAPAEDFGAIGTMTLQPNVAVTTVLTYKVDLLGGSGTVNHIAFIR